MRKVILGVGLAAILLSGVAVVAGAQDPPPPGSFGDRGPGPGGPMPGMFEFGGLVGGFGGKVVIGKPVLANFKITRMEALSGGNSISNTTAGVFARGADGSTYRDVKITALGPWAASGKAQEFAYIRNVTNGTQYIVNVTKGTYQAFPIRDHNPPRGGMKDQPDRSASNNESVTDNPNGSYTDPVLTTMVYPVDDRQVTRTIPMGAIGNALPIQITSERWYSNDLDLLMEETHTDPRFGTTTYQLSSIGQNPSASLFTPDPSLKQIQGRGFRGGHRGDGKQPPPPPQI